MRYMALKWFGEKPAKEEIYEHVKKVFGLVGFSRSNFRVMGEIIACDRKWVEKVRGALALKWQFKVIAISGTLKKLRNKLNTLKEPQSLP